MKNPRIVKAYNSINPSAAQKQRMLEAILAQAALEEPPKKKREPVVYTAKATKTSPWSLITGVAACLAVVILGGFVLLRVVGNQKPTPNFADPQTSQTTEATEPATTDAEGVYADVLDLYERAWENGWDGEMCRINGMSDLTPIASEGEGLYYAIADLDGDGTAELVIAEYPYREDTDTNLIDLYTCENGKPEQLYSAGQLEMTSLCQGGVLKRIGYERGDYQSFISYWRLKDGQFQPEKTVYQDTDGKWFAGITENTASPITKEEADTIVQSYQPAKLEFVNIEHRTSQQTSKTNYIPFDTILDKYEKALTEGWTEEQCRENDISPQILTALPKLGWCLKDLNGDGIAELVISDTQKLYDVYAMPPTNASAIHVVCAEGSDAHTLLADNTIKKQGFYPRATNWEFYRWNGDTLSMDYMVRYEVAQYSDGSASYFYGTSIDDLKPISKDEAGDRIVTAQRAQLELTLFTAQPKQSVDSATVFNPLISRYQQALTEKWNPGKCEEAGIGMMIGYAYDYLGKLGYAIQDIDKDGVDELIITDGENIYALYTITQEGEAAPERLCLFTAYERIQYYLTQENQIYCRGSGSAAVSYYTLYRLAGQKLIQLDAYMYDGETDPNNPWYFYDGDQQGDSCGSLDVQAILDGIQIAKIPFTPFDYDCPNE